MVQGMLGQKSLGATERYMHMSPERIEEYRKILDAVNTDKE
jgi:site-specific recombinase XerD